MLPSPSFEPWNTTSSPVLSPWLLPRSTTSCLAAGSNTIVGGGLMRFISVSKLSSSSATGLSLWSSPMFLPASGSVMSIALPLRALSSLSASFTLPSPASMTKYSLPLSSLPIETSPVPLVYSTLSPVFRPWSMPTKIVSAL